MRQQLAIPVTDTSQIGEVRRAAAALVKEIGMGETDGGRMAIIVTEVATNLVRYAKSGMILLRGEKSVAGVPTVELLSLDSGPGMDSERCMEDGFSTGGTPGNGLGAVRRLASEFDMHSVPGVGTALVARVTGSPRLASGAASFRYGYVCLPARGEVVCGDTLQGQHETGRARFMIADGLGHGPDAARASMCAANVFVSDGFTEPGEFLKSSHRAMNGTRGSAVAMAALDERAAVLHYAGVGNIAGVLYSESARRGLPSMNGIVGAILPRIQTFDYPLPASGMLVMHSDGLQTRWSLDGYPGILSRHPALIAGVLYRDFYRGRDDVSVLVATWRGGLS